MPMNTDPMKKFAKALNIVQGGMEQKESLLSMSTKLSLLSLDDIHRIAREGVKCEKDGLLVHAVMNWACALLSDLKEGDVKIMRVNKDA